MGSVALGGRRCHEGEEEDRRSQHAALLAEIDADLRPRPPARPSSRPRRRPRPSARQLRARSYQLGGLLSGCAASPSTCAASDLTSYHAAVADWQAGAWFQLTGHPVAAANQFEAAVVAAAPLGG
jgi:hypothetical protein